MKKRKGRKVGSSFPLDTGGVPFRILLVILTLIIVGGSLYVLLESQKKRNKIDHRKATELCDYGLQLFMEQILEKLNTEGDIEGIQKTDYDNGWYKVAVETSRSDTVLILTIKSEGGSGKQIVEREQKITLYRSMENGNAQWRPKAQ